ncbi:DNA/RNA polymerases superfamily protein [Gossypium australe]|uniref:DNA/RNA polymerases superfamily protein n=1 Tax=Gossypium australe TaxID=47621 RepID=A0A5B6VIK7_9ROSI|nr:DNA/RNA polymerases superfamily protein [Gossypium australe]
MDFIIGLPLSPSKILFSPADGRTNETKDMIQACVIDFEVGWECYLRLNEFVYNNNFLSNIQMAPYEALYG